MRMEVLVEENEKEGYNNHDKMRTMMITILLLLSLSVRPFLNF